MLTTNKRTINPMATMYDALNANFIPFIKLSTLGINFSIRKDLKARIALNDSKTFVPGKAIPKTLMHDGRANRTRTKSNLFHPSDQYLENPLTRILTIASIKNSKVNKLSMYRRISLCSLTKPLINIMPVLMSTKTSIIYSLVKKRFNVPILNVALCCFN